MTHAVPEKHPTAVKFVDEANWIIEGLILPYGGNRRDGNDLTGSHFTKNTDFCPDWFPDGGRPGLYQHGFDPAIGVSVVAREVKSWKDAKGTWLQGQIDKAHEYAAEIKQLVLDGQLHLSSGAVDHLVSIKAKTGEIERWPWVEWSFTPNPANPEAIVYQVKSAEAAAHLAVVKTDVPDAIKDSESAEDASTALWSIPTLITLLGDEEDPAQQARLRTAIGALQEYVGVEIAEIGTAEDIAETAAETAEEIVDAYIGGWLSRERGTKTVERLQSIHDATMSLGADCSGSGKASDTPPANVLAIRAGDVAERVVPVDLEAVKQRLEGIAIARAREIVGG